MATSVASTPPPADGSSGSWVVGCCLYVLGSVTTNFAQILLRLSHLSRRGTALWLLGFAVFAAGDLLNGIALSFTAQSLLEAIGSVQFVSNLIFSVLILREPLCRRHVVSTSCIVLGNLLILAWGDHHDHKMTVDRIQMLVKRRVFLAYILVVYPLSFAFGLWEAILSHRIRKQVRAESLLRGLGGAGRASLTQQTEDDIGERKILRSVLYALSSAMPGANFVLVMKTLTGLLHTYFQDRPSHTPSPTPPPTLLGEVEPALQGRGYPEYDSVGRVSARVVLAVLLVSAVAVAHIVYWLYRLNAALKRYPALFIIPLLQSAWILFTVVSGGIFFGEFLELSAHQVAGFVAGVCCVLLGIFLLVPLFDLDEAGGRRVGAENWVGEEDERQEEQALLSASEKEDDFVNEDREDNGGAHVSRVGAERDAYNLIQEALAQLQQGRMARAEFLQISEHLLKEEDRRRSRLVSSLLQSPPAAGHAPLQEGLQHRGAAAQSDQEDTGGVGSGMGVVGGSSGRGVDCGWIRRLDTWLSTPVGS